ncbi:ComEC/Rec2 family competence protein [uncultured Oscillibacter sp.]|uniref:ComEC/Rec2 family competence protein n=1 Tax=uncultured Oscillibacter sp. TaxID=876091 RepID=UPI00266F36D7|nr:MBL fold metallo-hydrolase [uncultured Oscillibacter sp.]
MQITIINVGYGDAILFQSSGGFTALLDGGSASESEFSGDPYRIRAADYMRRENVTKLDAVLISHIHEDHVCGLEPIFEMCSVKQLYVPYPVEPFLQGCELRPAPDAFRSVPLYTNALNAYRRILLRAMKAGTAVTVVGPGDTLRLGPELNAKVLAPKAQNIREYMELVEQAYASACQESAVTELLTKLDAMSNRTSTLLRFETAKIVFLSAADSCPREWDELPSSLLKDGNVLKLPHHGQIDSISEQFMKDMPLEYVITTASSDRRYNSANAEVYKRLTQWRAPHPPKFLFSDERSYPPYFSQPDGFQAITLEIDSGVITPKFIKTNEKENER